MTNYEKEVPEELEKFFWEHWLQYHEYIYSLCLTWCKFNEQDAEDLCSAVREKVYIYICRKNKKFDHFPTWISQVVKNHFFRQLDRDKKIIFYDQELNKEDLEEASFICPEENATTTDMETGYRAKLREFSETQQKVFNLQLEGYTPKEIAETCEMTPNAVYSALYKVRQKLQKDSEAVAKSIKKPAPLQTFHQICSLDSHGKVHYFEIELNGSNTHLKGYEAKWRQKLEKSPDYSNYQFALISNLFAQNRTKEAWSLLDKIDTRKLNRSHFLFKLQGSICFEKHRDAEALCQKALKVFPDTKVPLSSWNLLLQENYDELSEYIEDHGGTENEFNIVRDYFLLVIHEKTKQYETAYELCQSLILSKHCPVKAYSTILSVFVKLGKFEEALGFCDLIISQHKNCSLALFTKAHLMLCIGAFKKRNEEFISLYTKLLKKEFSFFPDIAVLKAFIHPKSIEKPLKRRLRDFPKCVLSQQYLQHFTGGSLDLSKLNSFEKLHFETVVDIYAIGGLYHV